MAEGTHLLTEGVLTNRQFNSAAAIARDKFAQQEAAKFAIALTDFRVWDAAHTNLPGTSATDDLGLYTGTWGSGPNYIGTSDLKAAGATTRRAGCQVYLPATYEVADTVLIRLNAGMITTVSDTTATIDVEAYRVKDDGTLDTTDLVTTSATTINSLTEADKDFTLTASDLRPGDRLEVRVSIAINDAATGTAVIGAFYYAHLVADIR